MTERDAERVDRLWALAVALFVFVAYALGACRTVYVGDSGELVTAVYLLGIPHPSSYPLYVMLGKLWTMLVPIGSIAFRMSLFSAACGAAACGLLYGLGRSMRLERPAALFSALLAAFGPSFWAEANIQRVYTLNALFVVLATGAAWRWYRGRKTRQLALAFLVCGIGAGNHLFMAVYAAALLAFVLETQPSLLRRPLALGGGVAAFAPGLVSYLYLPLRSSTDPRLDWGNPETLAGLVRVVTRSDFWDRAWVAGPGDLLSVAADYLASLATESAWIGVVLAVWGLVALTSARRFAWLPVFVMLGNFLSVAAHGSRTDIFVWHRYYIPSYLMLALLAGLGCRLLLRRLPRWLWYLPLLVPLLLLAVGWRAHDRSRYAIAEDFSRRVFESLPPGAHLIASDDNILFVLMYLHLVEKERPDVNLILQGVAGTDLPPLKFDPDVDPVFLTHHSNWDVRGLQTVPVGVVFRAWREGRPPPEPMELPEFLVGEQDPRVPRDHLTQNLIGHFHYMKGVTLEDRDWIGARREWELATEAAPGNDVLFYNLGLIYKRNGRIEDAMLAFERCREINPGHLTSAGRPRAADRLKELLAEDRRLAETERELQSDEVLAGLALASPARHRRMAELLLGRGETTAARGHLRRAVELEGS